MSRSIGRYCFKALIIMVLAFLATTAYAKAASNHLVGSMYANVTVNYRAEPGGYKIYDMESVKNDPGGMVMCSSPLQYGTFVIRGGKLHLETVSTSREYFVTSTIVYENKSGSSMYATHWELPTSAASAYRNRVHAVAKDVVHNGVHMQLVSYTLGVEVNNGRPPFDI